MVLRDYMSGDKGVTAYAGDLTSGGPSDQRDLPLMTIRKVSRVLGGRLPTLRLMEVVFHHVDLDAGYTFADADPGFVKRATTIAIERCMASGQAPSITLRRDEGEVSSIDDGAQDGTGSNAALLLWLARGDGGGLSSEAPLPQLPSWG